MATPRELRFCWWNVQDFAHFDANRSLMERWPTSLDQYREKRRRVDAAFDAMFGVDVPDVIGLCEITKAAAEDLQGRRFPNHELVLSSPGDDLPFQIAVFLRRGRSLSDRQVWEASDVSEGTRPMCVAQYQTRKAHILFVACHWPAFDETTSAEARRRCADRLRRGVYDFLYPKREVATPRYVIAFGDFNTEPHDELFKATLYASRDRDHARRRPHPTDDNVSRARMYNCGWRLFGEESPHGVVPPAARRVGTYYQMSSHLWRTFDQVLATGGLLTDQPPLFDEATLRVRTDVGNLIDGKPAKFEYEFGVGSGLSDHYPLTGRVVLSGEGCHAHDGRVAPQVT